MKHLEKLPNDSHVKKRVCGVIDYLFLSRGFLRSLGDIHVWYLYILYPEVWVGKGSAMAFYHRLGKTEIFSL